MNQEIINSIKTMKAKGNRLELPTGHMDNYAQMKAVLLKAGGKYVKNGFNFTEDAYSIQKRLCGGEKINDKKKFQFFPTPKPLAKRMSKLADIQEGDDVLEPSAGRGDLAEHLTNGRTLMMIELMPKNIKELINQDRYVIEGDFLKFGTCDIRTFDKIVANPPFTKHQDIDHIQHMYSLLNKNGRIVTIASQTAMNSSHKKAIDFRNWLHFLDAEIEELPQGTFKESGTNVGTVLIIINKIGE